MLVNSFNQSELLSNDSFASLNKSIITFAVISFSLNLRDELLICPDNRASLFIPRLFILFAQVGYFFF